MVARIQLRKRFPPASQVCALIIIFVVLTILLLRNNVAQPTTIRQVPYSRGSYDWSTLPQKHPVPEAEMARLPAGDPLNLPKIQFDFDAGRSDSLKRDIGLLGPRRNAVRNAFRKSWKSYVRHAWGYDELRPLSLRGKNCHNGWGATMIDSLDTLWIMGMYDDFIRVTQYLKTIDWSNSTEPRCNVFETNTRYLGGLLSAYDFTHDRILLDKAIELANMLYAAFDTPNRFPPYSFNFEELRAGKVLPDPYQSSAAAGSLSLEFTRLAQITGDLKFYDAIDRINLAFNRAQNDTLLPGLWPTFINVRDDFQTPNNVFSLSGDGELLYGYLPKMHILLGGLDRAFETMYRGAAKAVKSHLLFRPMAPLQRNEILLLGTAVVNEKLGKIDQIAKLEQQSCFAGGMFALAGKVFEVPDDVELGDKLTRGCAWAYRSFSRGLMPEKSQVIKCDTVEPCEWDEERWAAQSGGPYKVPRGFWRIDDAHYKLRPEAIQSLFILYRITGRQDLQDMAWDMFQAFQKATATRDAYASVFDVTLSQSRLEDSLESFFFAETLKYFYLIFSDPGLVDLDDWVFNTRGHPFKRPKVTSRDVSP